MIPPSCQGWHRPKRATVRTDPFNNPCVCRLVTAYEEQVGWNLQLGPNIGETNFWYIRINPMASSAGSRMMPRITLITCVPPAGDPPPVRSTRQAQRVPPGRPRAAPPTWLPGRAATAAACGAGSQNPLQPGPPRRSLGWHRSPRRSAARRHRTGHAVHGGWCHAPVTSDVVDCREEARQTVRRVRPLLRRDERMDRPARVRMRSRKPCFL